MSTSELTFGQAKHTLEIFAQQDLNEGDMLLLHNGPLADFLEGIHTSRGSCLPTRDELRVFLGLLPQAPTLTVDYGLPIEEMVDAGHYDVVWDNGRPGNINDYRSFKRTGVGIKKISIRVERIDENNIDLGENGAESKFGKKYRLASYEEILAFGATYPKVQRRCRHGLFGRSYKIRRPGKGDFYDRFHPNLWGGRERSRGISLTAGGCFANPGTHFLFVER